MSANNEQVAGDGVDAFQQRLRDTNDHGPMTSRPHKNYPKRIDNSLELWYI